MVNFSSWCSDLKHKAFPPKQHKASWEGRSALPIAKAYVASDRSVFKSRSAEDRVAEVAVGTMGVALGIIGAIIGLALLYSLLVFSFVAVVLVASALSVIVITSIALGSIRL